MTEARQKGVRKLNETRIKIHETKCGPPRVHRMNWKAWFEVLTRWRLKNDEERMKNVEERSKTFAKSLTETFRKRYGSASAWIFFTETIFSTQNSWNTSPGGSDTLQPIYRKKGEEVSAQLAQASWVASSRSNPVSKTLWKAQFQNFKIAICTPIFDKFTPFFRNLHESYGSL